ncbi:hypothetical protein PPTG_02705 [Phytophthora nicotianae INRA-310]|uniref:Uncharacterized protein n=1 Tax=Phytophthora nicotianae (strain INRA-310) TaxID=761204 RepID=W2RC57_PHYN3|nr:hypothetical protein PPTG_02705 [Phytophthora nicotianae INRA-310]ETN22972.1 hypothetical protein PPTG_02705 [Phytophthora nicotianae INRA-310]
MTQELCNSLYHFGSSEYRLLLFHQHELRQKYRDKISKLENQLDEAVHLYPQVSSLQANVEELEEHLSYISPQHLRRPAHAQQLIRSVHVLVHDGFSEATQVGKDVKMLQVDRKPRRPCAPTTRSTRMRVDAKATAP